MQLAGSGLQAASPLQLMLSGVEALCWLLRPATCGRWCDPAAFRVQQKTPLPLWKFEGRQKANGSWLLELWYLPVQRAVLCSACGNLT